MIQKYDILIKNYHIKEGQELKIIDLKRENCSVDYALAIVELEVESAKREGICAVKVLHGYGSHGKGGAILVNLRKLLLQWKKSGFIRDYFGGDKWNMFDKTTLEILMKDKTIYGDEDMNRANPGITIIYIS